MSVRVLALDIATTSGAAFDGPGDKPVFATLKTSIDGEVFGPAYSKFRAWVLDLLAVNSPDLLVIEAPWVPSGSRAPSHPTSTVIPRVLLGLAAIAEQVAEERRVEVVELAVNTVRKHFIGHGRARNPKTLVKRRCGQLGWIVRDDHQADAAALWCYAKSIRDPKWAPRGTPLFGRQEAA